MWRSRGMWRHNRVKSLLTLTSFVVEIGNPVKDQVVQVQRIVVHSDVARQELGEVVHIPE